MVFIGVKARRISCIIEPGPVTLALTLSQGIRFIRLRMPNTSLCDLLLDETLLLKIFKKGLKKASVRFHLPALLELTELGSLSKAVSTLTSSTEARARGLPRGLLRASPRSLAASAAASEKIVTSTVSLSPGLRSHRRTMDCGLLGSARSFLNRLQRISTDVPVARVSLLNKMVNLEQVGPGVACPGQQEGGAGRAGGPTLLPVSTGRHSPQAGHDGARQLSLGLDSQEVVKVTNLLKDFDNCGKGKSCGRSQLTAVMCAVIRTASNSSETNCNYDKCWEYPTPFCEHPKRRKLQQKHKLVSFRKIVLISGASQCNVIIYYVFSMFGPLNLTSSCKAVDTFVDKQQQQQRVPASDCQHSTHVMCRQARLLSILILEALASGVTNRERPNGQGTHKGEVRRVCVAKVCTVGSRADVKLPAAAEMAFQTADTEEHGPLQNWQYTFDDTYTPYRRFREDKKFWRIEEYVWNCCSYPLPMLKILQGVQLKATRSKEDGKDKDGDGKILQNESSKRLKITRSKGDEDKDNAERRISTDENLKNSMIFAATELTEDMNNLVKNVRESLEFLLFDKMTIHNGVKVTGINYNSQRVIMALMTMTRPFPHYQEITLTHWYPWCKIILFISTLQFRNFRHSELLILKSEASILIVAAIVGGNYPQSWGCRIIEDTVFV
ncbi:hypothetical protein WN51_10398 [Melipona quadrifasciata]|uniref:Uncharacterized protein n=1 Tax=Melipona quadrifasciata TaxID=166423 RepID=A0A0N0BHZ8_9HYME|nr:hypothetical protein WN51_10398 [Melipona quadrifasciata]